MAVVIVSMKEMGVVVRRDKAAQMFEQPFVASIDSVEVQISMPRPGVNGGVWDMPRFLSSE